MPTYVYRCKNCGHRFDAWQHMTDDPLTTCPECAGEINRMVFANSIVFKGSGFYSTDARHSQATDLPASTEGGEKPAAAAASESGAKTDNAAASKSESTTKSESSSKSESSAKGDSSSTSTSAPKTNTNA